MSKTKIFFDFEFTGLHRHTTPISLGMVSECGQMFYAEFRGYDTAQVSEWVEENVINNLTMQDQDGVDEYLIIGNPLYCKGYLPDVGKRVRQWLTPFDSIEFWGDVPHYDWVLMCELIGVVDEWHTVMPSNIFYLPFDLATHLKSKGYDPDVSRAAFSADWIADSADGGGGATLHNALWDARMIKACYERIERGGDKPVRLNPKQSPSTTVQ